MELLKRKILLANCLLNEACYFRFKKKKASSNHSVLNMEYLIHWSTLTTVDLFMAMFPPLPDSKKRKWCYKVMREITEVGSFTHLALTLQLPCGYITLPLVQMFHKFQEKQKGWCISMSIFLSPRYKWKWTKPRQTYCPKVFLPSF